MSIKIKTFLSSDSWTVPADVTSVEVLVVAGGGAGQQTSWGGGGGGGGGVIYHPSFPVTPNASISVVVGAGGNGATPKGGDSFFGSLQAMGGGSPIGSNWNGGSGGGGSHSGISNEFGTATQTSNNGGTGYGHNGGTNQYPGDGTYPCGSGGGAGTAGGQMAAGGNGVAFSISGTSTYYGGGGGAGNINAVYTSGGLGGGGTHGAGTNGLGGGGGGGLGAPNGIAMLGGSGVVIIKYESATAPAFYPYSIGSAPYGTLSSVYSWYVQWYQYPTNTSTITTTGNITLNSATIVSEGVQLSLTIYDIANISRAGTSGYTAPTFTYKSKPTINVRNVNLATNILAYNTELSTDVAAGGSGDTITGSIVHSQTLNVTVPLSWFFTENNTWKFTISNLLTIVNTSVTQTNTREATFIVPPMFNVMVRYNNELVRAKNIWVRKDDTLQLVKSLTVKN